MDFIIFYPNINLISIPVSRNKFLYILGEIFWYYFIPKNLEVL
jgi:hypothetical protein